MEPPRGSAWRFTARVTKRMENPNGNDDNRANKVPGIFKTFKKDLIKKQKRPPWTGRRARVCDSSHRSVWSLGNICRGGKGIEGGGEDERAPQAGGLQADRASPCWARDLGGDVLLKAHPVPEGRGLAPSPPGTRGHAPSPPGTRGHAPSPKKTGHKLFPLKVCGASSPWRLGHPVCLSPRRPGVEHVYGPSHALSILEATQEVAGGGPLRPSEQHQRGANKTRGLNKTKSHPTSCPKRPGENVNYSSHQERRRSQTK